MGTTGDAIDVSGVSFRYPGADEPTLTDADFRVGDGEFVAVLGGNGSGKTTLCKTFNGLVPHFFDGEFDGTVTVAGRDVETASVAELSRDVGYVFQEFENQLVTPTVFEELTFGPMNYGRDDYRERAHRTLDELDIETVDGRFIWELSGGQQHLVALGAALSMDPEVLVVDEPAAQLDPAHAKETYEQLRRLNDEGMTVVAIEHHTEFIAEYCDSVALVADGRVRWKRPTDEALNRLSELREQDSHPPQVTRVADRLFDEGPLPTTFRDGLARFRSLSPPESASEPAADAAAGAGADSAEAGDAGADDGPTAADDDAVIVDDGPAADDAGDGDSEAASERDDADEETGEAAAVEGGQEAGAEPESDEDIIVADPDASGVAEPGDGDDIIVASESEPAGDVGDEDLDDDTDEDLGDNTGEGGDEDTDESGDDVADEDTDEGGDDVADEDLSGDTEEDTRDASGEPDESVESDEPTQETGGDAASGDAAGDESMAGGRAAAELEATGPDAATEEESDAIPDADETAREAATGRDEGAAGADSGAGDDIDDELAGSIPFRDDDTGTMNTVLSEEDEEDGDGEETTDDAGSSSADDEDEEEGGSGFFSRLLGR